MNKVKIETLMLTIGCILAGVYFAGCGKGGSAADTDGDKTVTISSENIDAVFVKVDGLLSAGKTNEAKTAFFDAVQSPKFASVKSDMFHSYLRFLARCGDIETAKIQYLNMLRTDEKAAQPGFSFIYAYLINEVGEKEALEWAKVLANEPISTELRITASEWLVNGLLRSGQYDEAIDVMKGMMGPEIDSAQRARLLLGVAATAAYSNTLQGAIVLVKIRELAAGAMDAEPEDFSLASACKAIDVYRKVVAKNWDGIVADMKTSGDTMRDMDLLRVFVFAVSAAKGDGKYDVVDAISEAVLLCPSYANIPNSHRLAAREWIDNVFVKNGGAAIAEFPVRISQLESRGMTPRSVHSILSAHFFSITDKPDIVKACIPILEGLLPKIDDESEIGMLKLRLLDAYYLTGNYDGTIELLNSGIPEKDETWIKMTIAKVKADKALANKNYDDAIANFRVFVECILADEEQLFPDPTSKLLYTKEMIAGKNMKRIGDIQKKAGKSAAEIKESYDRAREMFENTLATGKDLNTETVEWLKSMIKDVSEVPSAEKAAD